MPEPRSHYQLSFTARQAMVFFLVCLLALGLSFFFGLMTGLSGGGRTVAGPGAATPTAVTAGPNEAEAGPGAESPSSETNGGGPGAAGEPTPPAVLQAFEDHPAEPTPAPTAVRSTAARPAPPAAPAPGGSWIQVASLTARPEAETLAARLSKHGYHCQVVGAQGPKGRVFRVRVGPYRSEDEATRAAEKLRRQEKIRQPWVVRDGK